jgi:formate/nitrite transporter FocA (FNT family)
VEEEKINKRDDKEAEALQAPSAKIIHDAIYKEAVSELSRSSSALFWSGLAAGLSMGFSMISEGLLKAYLPDEDWSFLVSNLGYSVGFIIVILGKQQLFTENTLTPLLPLFDKKSYSTLFHVLRLWGVVLVANLVGALIVSYMAARTEIFDPHVQEAFAAIGQEAMEPGFGTTLLRGIFAGWVIALIVWLIPYAETARIWVIIFLTYIIGIGHFSHVIAGSVETFTLALMSGVSWSSVLSDFVLPSLIGNMLGGITIVALLNHAQVKTDN